MTRPCLAAWIAAATLALSATAADAQVLSRAPEWARALLVTEPDAVNVRQTALGAPEGGIAVRLSIAPAQGGVARLVRFESSPAAATLAMRRFTGHNRNGWVLWGAEQAVQKPLDATRRASLERLARAALAAGALGGEGGAAANTACANGDYAWLEISDPSRTAVFERRCAMDGASGALIRALSDAAGDKDEEALFQAGVAEVMAADAAFAQQTAEGFVPEGVDFPGGGVALEGQDAIAAHYAGADPVRWTPVAANVSARGDMAWSWGRWSRGGNAGTYLAVWKRDGDGAWRAAARMLN